ncbi:hypothetical protein NE865_14303 [Phthorimaea operculella]|nr:hypothetical protein NE865_14303 [Phthorimaea operculella]
MATSTILRVKRRLEDNPQDALVLMCKRMKTDTEEISPSLFVFRGTVENEETAHVKNIVPKSNTSIKATSNVSKIIQKIRKERKETSTEHRYEVVNCSRGLNNKGDEDIFDLIDLKQKTEAEAADVQYAYDLYTSYTAAAAKDFDISMIDNLVSIENYETDLILGSYRDNGRQTPSSDGADDDDDSNDENNWRNDYPEEDASSIDEDDMIRAVERLDIEDDLSSDTGEDKIYDDPPDIFNEDVKRYGEAYAKYKAKAMAEYPDLAKNTPFVHSTTVKDLDEESVDGYKEDSEDDGFYYGQEEDTDHFKEQYRDDSSDEYSPD